MANNTNIIEKSLSTAYSSELTKEELIAFTKLQQSARNFLKNIDFIQKWAWHAKSISEAINIYYNYTQDTKFIQKCFVEINKFETSFNNFLGRKNYLTIVNQQGKIFFIGQKKASQIYKEIYPNTIGSEEKGTKEGRGKGRYKNLPQAKDAIKNFNNELLDKMRKQVNIATSKRGAAYATAIERMEAEMDYKKQFPRLQSTFYWRTGPSSIGYTYIGEEEGKTGYNKGRVAQAYAEAIINNRNNSSINFLNEQEFIHFISNNINKENIPAIVRGDIVLKENGSIHFAVKAENASTAAIQPYLGFAYYLALTKPISKNELQKKIDIIFKEKRTVANTILADLLQVSEKTLKKYLPQYQQLLIKVLS